MAGELNLDPQLATNGAHGLSAAGADLQAVRNNIGGQIQAKSGNAPWGKDEYGGEFEKGYREGETQILQAWSQIATFVSAMGEGVKKSVEMNVGADDGAGARISRIR
jgi:hypothetical protein